MAEIRSIDQIAEKWATVTPRRVADYEAGVRAPRRDWATATAAAEGAWEEGVQRAIADNAFPAGVNRAGTQKWQTNTLSKGAQRWGPGVQLGRTAYQEGFSPFRNAIANLTLPPRFARRDPRNMDRVQAVVNAMIETARGLVRS